MKVNHIYLFCILSTLFCACTSTTRQPREEAISTSVSSPSPSPSPITYDVICFQRHALSTMGVECDPDQIFKIPRGTEVTTYLETKTSVQSGKNTINGFRTDKQTEKISDSEMESLSSQDSRIYVLDMTSDTVLVGSLLSGEKHKIYACKVNVFNRNDGKFQLFGQGEFQKLGEDTSKFIFTAGDTEIKQQEPTIPPSTTPSSSSNSEPSNPSATSNSATKFIQVYYQLLNDRSYRTAWGRLSTKFQLKSNDYKQWWDKVKNIRVDNVKSISQNENEAIVEAQISYELKDGRIKQDRDKQLHLLWNKNKNEWEIDG
jgi:uncharacterized protein (DUF2147 family)